MARWCSRAPTIAQTRQYTKQSQASKRTSWTRKASASRDVRIEGQVIISCEVDGWTDVQDAMFARRRPSMPSAPQDFKASHPQSALCHEIIDQPQTAMNPVAYLRSSPQQLSG